MLPLFRYDVYLMLYLVWCFIQERASLSDHLCHSLLQLGTLLHQVDDPLVQTFGVSSLGQFYIFQLSCRYDMLYMATMYLLVTNSHKKIIFMQ